MEYAGPYPRGIPLLRSQKKVLGDKVYAFKDANPESVWVLGDAPSLICQYSLILCLKIFKTDSSLIFYPGKEVPASPMDSFATIILPPKARSSRSDVFTESF